MPKYNDLGLGPRNGQNSIPKIALFLSTKSGISSEIIIQNNLKGAINYILNSILWCNLNDIGRFMIFSFSDVPTLAKPA